MADPARQEHPRFGGRWPVEVLRGALRVSAVLAALFIVAIMLLNVGTIASRTLRGAGISGTVEYSEVLLVAVVYLALAYAQHTDAHVSTSLVTERVSPRLADLLRATGLTMTTIFLVWFVWATFRRGVASLEIREARMGLAAVPIWPARLVIPAGLSLLLAEVIVTTLERWARVLTPRSE